VRLTRGNNRILTFVVIFLLLTIAGGWYYYSTQLKTAKATADTSIKTAKVRSGDLVISVSGTGSLAAAQEAGLGFRTGGRLAEVLVQVGDRVQAGQPLARLDDAEARTQVAQAEINLKTAELKLAELKHPPSAAAIDAARDNLTSAQAAQRVLQSGLTAQEIEIARIDVETAKQNLDQAQNKLWAAQAKRDGIAGSRASAGYEVDAANADVHIAEVAVDQAQGAYTKASLAYEQKVAEPPADAVAAARAKVASAQAQVEALLEGPTAEDEEAARLAIEQASNNLSTARLQLENTVLKAPFAATVTAVQANPGELVGTAPLVHLAVLDRPLVRAVVEESDLEVVTPGNVVNVTAAARPDKPLQGKVVRISPVLELVDGVPSAEVIVELDAAPEAGPLRVGMSMEIEIIAAEARDVLLVPVEALRDVSPGRSSVFVVKDDGQLELRMVEVGLRDFANAEIKSGLQKGETVSTGNVQT